MSTDIHYPEAFIKRLHTIWGDGFLSPGGPEEVGEIVRDVDLTDKTVLDVGFGTGGPAIVLVKNHNAGKVSGIDVEPQLLDRAQININRAGVASRITLRIVEAGPLPFSNESFDVVFSKDSILHIHDKHALFKEIKRVLKPDGVFVASDWLSGGDENAILALNQLRDLAHLTFEMATATEMERALSEVGFQNISSRDRNAWFIPIINLEVEQIEGPLWKKLIDEFGKEIIEHWIKVKRLTANAASAGGLRPTHLKAFKPSS